MAITTTITHYDSPEAYPARAENGIQAWIVTEVDTETRNLTCAAYVQVGGGEAEKIGSAWDSGTMMHLKQKMDWRADRLIEELAAQAATPAPAPKTSNGVEMVHGTQVLLRGTIPMVLYGAPLVAGLWRPGPGIAGTAIGRTGAQIARDSDATLEKHARYPLLKEKDMKILASGRVFQEWEVGWWIDPNNDPATHIDYEDLMASAREIYANS